MQMKKSKQKKSAIKVIALFIIRPFIVPILIIAIFIAMICSITDILYVAYNNEDKIDIKSELKYYEPDKDYEKDEQKCQTKQIGQ